MQPIRITRAPKEYTFEDRFFLADTFSQEALQEIEEAWDALLKAAQKINSVQTNAQLLSRFFRDSANPRMADRLTRIRWMLESYHQVLAESEKQQPVLLSALRQLREKAPEEVVQPIAELKLREALERKILRKYRSTTRKKKSADAIHFVMLRNGSLHFLFPGSPTGAAAQVQKDLPGIREVSAPVEVRIAAPNGRVYSVHTEEMLGKMAISPSLFRKKENAFITESGTVYRYITYRGNRYYILEDDQRFVSPD